MHWQEMSLSDAQQANFSVWGDSRVWPPLNPDLLSQDA